MTAKEIEGYDEVVAGITEQAKRCDEQDKKFLGDIYRGMVEKLDKYEIKDKKIPVDSPGWTTKVPRAANICLVQRIDQPGIKIVSGQMARWQRHWTCFRFRIIC